MYHKEKKDMTGYTRKIVEPATFLDKLYCGFFENINASDCSKDMICLDSVVSMSENSMNFSVVLGKENITTLADLMQKVFVDNKYSVTRKDEPGKVKFGSLRPELERDERFYGTTVALKDANSAPGSFTYSIAVLRIPMG